MNKNQFALNDVTGAVLVLGLISLVILPLPPTILDLLITVNVGASVLIFLMASYVEKPLDFSAFPSVLLLTTLFRLALNVATTRIVLLKGPDGTAAAGHVIEAFGQFALGGNFVVGFVVFLILVIVNFIVITKGADRIAEVAARFTLDSLPGKQMAIDAELAAGHINEKDAKARRKEVEMESDFYGSMDGASKFVRGDAVAGLLIVAINIVGGMIIGVAQGGMTFGDAITTFSILSIGDGLVSQIPALLISTGAALLATRGSAASNLTNSLSTQLFGKSKALMIVAIVLATMALMPGMPHFLILSIAAALGFVAFRGINTGEAELAAAAVGAGGALAPAKGIGENGEIVGTNAAVAKTNNTAAQKAEIESLLPIELLSLEVGLDLLPLVDANRDGELLARIASLRKQMALELGFIVPPVHVRDDLRMRPNGYRVLISGMRAAQGEIRVGRMLAIDPSGRATMSIAGESVREPTFGLPAKWIAPSERGRAETGGCTVVDASAVIATHLTEVVRRHAHELLGRREAQELLDLAGKTNAKVIEELVPHMMPLGDVIKVLRNLLQEGISIRDIRTILEALADSAMHVKDTNDLTELVRQRLARQISSMHATETGELRAMVLDPRAEELFRQGGRGSADPQALSKVTAALEVASRRAVERDEPAVLVVAPDVRRALSAVAIRHVPGLSVMSYREIDPSIPLVTREVISA